MNRFVYAPKRQCDVCSGHKYDLRYVKEYLAQFGVEVLSKEYHNNHDKLELRCSCGRVYEASWCNIHSKAHKVQCNVCSIGKEHPYWTQAEVEDYLNSVGLQLLSPYHNDHDKLKIKCVCGTIFERSLNKIRSDGQTRCIKCTKSKSYVEMFTTEYLIQHNINFKSEYIFDDLRAVSGLPLRFDFALLDRNDELMCLIEMDGEHHYLPVKKWGGEEALAVRHIHDAMKAAYCEDHGYALYRIPYWKFNQIQKEMANITNMVILCQASQ